jgi:tripartite ATP-independent transporter DctM subunit
MIPPSIPFILYGILTEESIGRLFIAGIFPGLLIAILFMAAIYISCRRNPQLGPAGPKASLRERFTALYYIWGILVLFVLVLGGMYGGFFTPTEAGAVGAFGALVLGLAKRKLNWKNLSSALVDTARLTGMIFLLIIGSMIFGYFMAVTEVPFWLADTFSVLPVPPIVIVIILLVMYVILGFFVEILAIMVLTVPIIYPVLLALSIDPIWFGVLVVVTVMIGQVTPPVGVVVYAVGGLVREVPLFTIFRGVWPYLYAMLIALIILVAFPQISLWLPDLMRSI